MTALSRGAYVQVPEPGPLTAARSESRVRSQLVGVRLTPAEKAHVDRIAAANGMTACDVLRAGLQLVLLTEGQRNAPDND